MRGTHGDIHFKNMLPSICPIEESQESFGTFWMNIEPHDQCNRTVNINRIIINMW